MPWKLHTHLKTRESKGRESQGPCRVSETNERGTKKLSTYALPSEGSVPLEVQYFFDEGLYSKWVCMQLYILILKYLKKENRKNELKTKKLKKKLKRHLKNIKFFWSWCFAVFNPACLKKYQIDFWKRERDVRLFCVCVCVCVCVLWAFVWACKRETERESKKGSTWFSKERETKKKKN